MRRLQQQSSISSNNLPSPNFALHLQLLHNQFRTLTNAERQGPGARSVNNRRKRNPFDTRTDPRKRNIALPHSLPGEGGPSNLSGDPSSTSSHHHHLNKNSREESFLRKSAYEQRNTISNFEQGERSQQLLWDGVVITDHSNETISHFLKLQENKKYRDNERCFSQSGQNLMAEMAKKFKVHPRHLLVKENKEVPEWVNRDKTEVVKVSAHVMDDLYPGNDGYIGDFEMPEPPMKEELMVNKKKFRSVLVLDNIYDAGQLGSMIRLATAFCYDAVFLVNQCADLYHRDVLNSSRGVLFQKMTPIYVLKTENGDDVDAMINHVIERNDLEPLLLTPNAPKEEAELTNLDQKPELLSPIARTAFARQNTTNSNSQKKDEVDDSKTRRVKTLHEVCLESFTGWYDRTESVGNKQDPPKRLASSSIAEDQKTENESEITTTTTDESSSSSSNRRTFESKRHILCVSSDHKGTFERRMRQSIRSSKPVTTLLLDEDRTTSDLVESFPVALYQLRDTARWEFLPPSARAFEAASSSMSELHKQFAESDFPNESTGPSTDDERNMPEEEYAHMIRAQKAEIRDRRINRFKASDEDIYRSWEDGKLNLDLVEMHEKRGTGRHGDLYEDAEEREERFNRRRGIFERKRELSPIPDPIIEQDQSINRDVLREQEQWAEQYEAPPNYHNKELKTPQWRTPRYPEERRKVHTVKQTAFYKRYEEMQQQLSKDKQKKVSKFYGFEY